MTYVQTQVPPEYQAGGASLYKDYAGNTTQEIGDPFGMQWSLIDPTSDNSNAYYYGGERGAADADLLRARALADAARKRGPVQADLAQDQAVRGQQDALAGAYQGAMAGNGPSLAGYQMQRGLDQANAAAGAAAARARPMGLAGAQRAAMMGAAGQTGALANQSGATREAEMGQVYGEYGGLANAMRGADQSAAARQAELAARSQALNDRTALAREKQALGIAEMGMTGEQARGQARRGWQNVAQAGAQQEQAAMDARRQRDVNTGLGIVQAATSLGGMAGGFGGGVPGRMF